MSNAIDGNAGALGEELQRASFEDLRPERPVAGISEHQLEVIRNIPVTLAMEIGRTMLNIHNLLELTPGSVVKLERPVGEPLDILVNGCLIARGEVVVVNDKFGMRITDIVSPEERVRKLR